MGQAEEVLWASSVASHSCTVVNKAAFTEA